MKAVTLFFDYVSPYAYLAWKRLGPLATQRGFEVELKPTLFAGLLGHWGQLGPAEVPPKRVFMFKDILRRGAEAGIEIAGPPAHPFNPLRALRVSLRCACGEHQNAVVTALFDACWQNGQDIESEADIRKALDSLEVDVDAMIEASQRAPAKQALRDNGLQAVSAGVFGVPTIVANDELFFGHDRIGDLVRYLEGNDPVDAVKLEAMLRRPSSAQRRQ